MSASKTTGRKPAIRISRTDYSCLSTLVSALAGRDPDIFDELLTELERARVVADGSVAPDVVQMGSTVTFKPETGETRAVTLVFPGEADIALGRVSVLTPIGAALIGVSTGQSMTWMARDGRRHELSVLAVNRAASSDDDMVAGGFGIGRPGMSGAGTSSSQTNGQSGLTADA